MSSLDEFCTSKADWRSRLLRQRDELDEPTRQADDRALLTSLLGWLRQRDLNVVAAYVPVGPEPGADLPALLREAGLRVLLPIVRRKQPLDWAEYTGPDSLEPATFGLLEPAGERLGPDAISRAEVVLVPALGIDHRGVRLGRGAGHYDRSLPLRDSAAELLGVVRDSEFVPALPGEDHDVRMTSVVTPSRGVVRLPV
ncbi:5-formyltetrahydrofolate cyclo-ligase [Saccharopolyspora sp. TS4A08]|uniref:5-formyltetrahydrofolate cyclo-ligase n=1 Tax=Saccharopolyspora ipomoeae TaxID=3042027 RepID=A0ABT6PVM5_9PSEU|nr:5-formyltetrahydrofolate cyclo-ligase [Saccharopolyspora sp. TS4A08]MDI2031927.1 5-formyltetrahydrofolate cyclo-ligase [Saccharopolyspora sp. TS4A08]